MDQPDESCGSTDADGNGKAGDCHGWNFTTNSPDVDNGSYGTHGASVSGVVGGRLGNGNGTAGVAPDVTIMPLVIGSGSSVDMTLGAEAIRYAVDHGADVINASWGGAASGWALDNLRSAIAYAGAHGVLVVAAAGNDCADRDARPMYPASLTEPNAGDRRQLERRRPDQRVGLRRRLGRPLRPRRALVFTTWNDGSYRLVSGTSIALPQVAAAYALYRAAWPNATAAELRQACWTTSTRCRRSPGKSVTGGRLSIGLPGRRRPRRGPLHVHVAVGARRRRDARGSRAAGEDVAGDYAVTLGLGMAHEGEIWAVADKDVTLGDATGTTDDAGEVQFDLGTAASPAELDLSPSLALGDGRYVLTVQLHRDGMAVGRTFAAPLLVGSAPPVDRTRLTVRRRLIPTAPGGSTLGLALTVPVAPTVGGSDGSGSDGSGGQARRGRRLGGSAARVPRPRGARRPRSGDRRAPAGPTAPGRGSSDPDGSEDTDGGDSGAGGSDGGPEAVLRRDRLGGRRDPGSDSRSGSGSAPTRGQRRRIRERLSTSGDGLRTAAPTTAARSLPGGGLLGSRR